jgi:hypothetical protein
MVVMKSSVFWNITLCSPLKVNRRFRRICHLHLQGWKMAVSYSFEMCVVFQQITQHYIPEDGTFRTKFWLGNLDSLTNQGKDEWIILKCTAEEQVVKVWMVRLVINQLSNKCVKLSCYMFRQTNSTTYYSWIFAQWKWAALPMCRRDMLLPSSGSKSGTSSQHEANNKH